MKYLNKSFSVHYQGLKYSNNWEWVYGKQDRGYYCHILYGTDEGKFFGPFEKKDDALGFIELRGCDNFCLIFVDEDGNKADV